MDRDSSVGIATSYVLDDPGIESRWGGEVFRTGADRPWGPPSLLCNGYQVFFAGRGLDHPLPSSAEVKERVELYLYSLSGAFVVGYMVNWAATQDDFKILLGHINVQGC